MKTTKELYLEKVFNDWFHKNYDINTFPTPERYALWTGFLACAAYFKVPADSTLEAGLKTVTLYAFLIEYEDGKVYLDHVSDPNTVFADHGGTVKGRVPEEDKIVTVYPLDTTFKAHNLGGYKVTRYTEEDSYPSPRGGIEG